ncbi:site-specific recombinase XerD [Ruminococcaceae bacterium R-25]|nr:site-specific recombinase XerD [Ruminococcaceae bacterium R-25]SUQ22618.1 Site-specific recombinase XerD [Oscillospiraceae bacterium]
MIKRRDNKGRILHNGEIQLSDGKYRFKYVDSFGSERFIYSWRLDRTDIPPAGKRNGPSLRELEKQVQLDELDHIISRGGNLTVLELVEKYVQTKTGVRITTRAGYGTVINILKKDPFGAKRIDKVKISDAKVWLISLQQEHGRGYSSIHTIRGVLKPAFQMAVDDDLIRKNPFGFQLVEVIINDSIRREAITREQERKFLQFVKEDAHFSRYYDGIYVLFMTGMRISEFCGLTVSDIDFKNHVINIDHQLHKKGSYGYYIEKTKTESGTRKIPMTRDVEEAFERIVANRNAPKVEPTIEGRTGFLFFDKDGSICYNLHWEHYFKHIIQKYNSIYKVPLPKITPHICRHTYCTNMAKSGMNPKTLQYLMGHSDIGITLNTYTHINLEDAKAEVLKISAI